MGIFDGYDRMMLDDPDPKPQPKPQPKEAQGRGLGGYWILAAVATAVVIGLLYALR